MKGQRSPLAAADESPGEGHDENYNHEAGDDHIQHSPFCPTEKGTMIYSMLVITFALNV